MKVRRLGSTTRLFAFGGVVCISFAAIFVRLAAVSPDTAAFFRGLYALPGLACLWLVVRRSDARTRVMRRLAVASGVLLAVDLSFWHRAIADIGAGLATVLANTQVVFVALAAWMLHRERPTRLALLFIPVVFAGVVLISGLGAPGAYGEAPLWGAALGTVAGVAYAAYLLVFRASNRALAHPAGPLLDATVGMTVGALVIGIATDPGLTLLPHWPAHGWLLALALLPQTLGWLLIAVALPRLAALETSVLLLLQPVMTMVWGWLIFGESMSPLQLGGAALVLGGVATLSIRGSVAPDAPVRDGSSS